MTPEQFCYWLQGRAELVPTPPSEAEWNAIHNHLQAVFKKVTPARSQLQDLADRQASPLWPPPYERQAVPGRLTQAGTVFEC